MEKIGIVGVGAMGSALLQRLKLAGLQVTVHDCHAPSLETARSMGADIASSAAALSRASTIVDVVVRTDEEVLDCMMGKDGVLEGARAGTLVLLHSTILPQTTQKVADAARRSGVYVMDACMAGVPSSAVEGELGFLVGGPAELVDRARPHLLQMGKKVLHVGPLGSGNVAKLIVNLATGAETLIIHEALRIGEAAGIVYPEMIEILRESYLGTVLNRWQSVFDPAGSDPTPRSGKNIFGKDIPLAARLIRQYGLELPITAELIAAAKRVMDARHTRGR